MSAALEILFSDLILGDHGKWESWELLEPERTSCVVWRYACHWPSTQLLTFMCPDAHGTSCHMINNITKWIGAIKSLGKMLVRLWAMRIMLACFPEVSLLWPEDRVKLFLVWTVMCWTIGSADSNAISYNYLPPPLVYKSFCVMFPHRAGPALICVCKPSDACGNLCWYLRPEGRLCLSLNFTCNIACIQVFLFMFSALTPLFL